MPREIETKSARNPAMDVSDLKLALARISSDGLTAPADPASIDTAARVLQRLFMLPARRRPAFRIDSVFLDDAGCACPVTETAVEVEPFCTLLHFSKPRQDQPRLLIVAPMSGHWASQLRDTVLAMLPEHDVYLTDWHDAQQVPLSAGAFPLDEYIAYLMRFLQRIGPGAHVLAVCQACVPALGAAALLAEDRHPARPASLSLLAGPIDARINPTVISRYATSAPLEWFERNLISTVAAPAAGAGRRVYRGELQMLSSLGIHWRRSMEALGRLWSAPFGMQQAAFDLYAMLSDEQLAVQDLAAEFYLDNLDLVFRRHALARGLLRWRGRPVRPQGMQDIGLFTVEAQQDDICGAGQTAAAHQLCSDLPASLRRRHVEPGIGHKEVFTGAAWRMHIQPRLRDFMRATHRLRHGNT
jgi:poly(3-hydroxybutyrate) depolymerase